MNLFREKALIMAIAEKYRRLDRGEIVEFTPEEADFAGAFQEDAIRLEDVDQFDEAVKHHEE